MTAPSTQVTTTLLTQCGLTTAAEELVPWLMSSARTPAMPRKTANSCRVVLSGCTPTRLPARSAGASTPWSARP